MHTYLYRYIYIYVYYGFVFIYVHTLSLSLDLSFSLALHGNPSEEPVRPNTSRLAIPQSWAAMDAAIGRLAMALIMVEVYIALLVATPSPDLGAGARIQAQEPAYRRNHDPSALNLDAQLS